ncbi:MAG: adenosine-specific kinase [candidate division Zixibacteria bacterium]|nr:adenosine-specific kinase [candidate division Zixibacteria bacterium]
MNIEPVPIQFPEGSNIIFGQSHFIKTVEDLHEVMATSTPTIKFGLAFSEASGPCLVRYSGNDAGLAQIAADNILRLACGHTFLIVMTDAFPIHVLNAVKSCPEVCRIFCATGNPITALVVRGPQGGGVIGVIDGSGPKGIETPADQDKRRAFLRQIGLKL